MKKIFNKKAFTLVEIVVAIGILAAASVGIGAIVVAVQNNSQKQFSQGDLQQQLADVQDTLKNDLLTTNAGVKYWIQDDMGSYVESDGANKNPERNKIVAMYTMDYIDNTLTKTYVRYDAAEDILYKAESSETVTFDHSKKMLLDEKPEEVSGNTSLEWYVYAQGITNFSMDLSKYSENQTINYNVNIGQNNSDYESDNTVNIRNEIPINDATVLENYDQAVVSRPALKNTSFVYNGQEQAPKQLDVNSRYVEIRITDPDKDKLSATNVGQYRITYHLKNAVWSDGTTEDYTIEWEIIPRELVVKWTEFTWVYDNEFHTAQYTISNYAPDDNISEIVELHNGVIGRDYGTQEASLVVKNNNYIIKENQTQELSITKGVATFTVVPTPAGTPEQPLQYNGQKQPLVNPGSTTCGTIYYSLSANADFSTSIPEVASANSETPYVVYYYIKGEGSYSDSEKKYIEVVMQRAMPAVTPPVPYDDNHPAYYNGAAQPLLYKAGITSAATSDESNMLYSLDGTTYSSALPTGVTATEYTIWYKSKETVDFKESEPQYVIANIGKTERPLDSFTLPKVNDLTYTGEMQPLFEEGTGTAAQAQGWMYKLEDGEWSWDIPQKEAAGDYPVYLKVPETNDYAEYVLETPVIVTIKKARAEFLPGGNPTALPNLIYSGQLQNLIANGITRHGIVHYGLSADAVPPNKDVMTTHTPQGVGAGTYEVFYYIKGDSNHLDSDITRITAKINKATPIVTTTPIALDAPYNGEEQMLVTLQGQSDSGLTLQYSLDGKTDWSEVPPSKINANEYTVYYKVPANENYADSEIGTLVAKITQANTHIIQPEPLPNLVYNGETQQLCKVGSTEFGDMEYSINSLSQWTYNAPTAVNAGEYSIYWRVQGTTDYKGADGVIYVTVSKDTIDFPQPKAALPTYNGEAQALIDINSILPPDGYHLEYRFEEPTAQWSSEIPTGVNAGVYYIEYRLVANNDDVGDNISSAESRLITEIKPVAPTVIVNAPADLTYNNEMLYLIDPQNTSTNFGTLEYALSLSGPYTTTLPQAKNAGTYVVYWRTKASDNLLQQKGSYTITIAKKPIELPVVSPLQMEYNGTELFPDITADFRYIEIISGETGQTAATESGYTITFMLSDPDNTEWAGHDEETYDVVWRITKGAVAPYTAPAATTPKYTGYEQLLVVPGFIAAEDGSLRYRLAAYKGLDDTTWIEYTEEDQPWSPIAPKGIETGSYKILYKITSYNYENVPETELISTIERGQMTVRFGEEQAEYTGENHRCEVTVDWLGHADNITDQDEVVKNEDGTEIIIQHRAIIEISDDGQKTWKKYVSPKDTNEYDATKYFLGKKDVGSYNLAYRVTDPLNQYEPYLSVRTYDVTYGIANWEMLPAPVEDLVYTGAAQSLIQLPDESKYKGLTFQFQVTTATEQTSMKEDGTVETTFILDESGWSSKTTNPQKTKAGTYAIKVLGIANSKYKIKETNDAGEEILSDTATLDIIYVNIQKRDVTIKTYPSVAKTILYNTAANQWLGISKGALENSGDSYLVYQILYYATPDSTPSIHTNGIGNSAKNKNEQGEKVFYINGNITSSSPKAKEVGTYKIIWWVVGDANHNDYVHIENGINQSAMVVEIVDNPKNVVASVNVPYTGKEQQLFTVPTSINSKTVYVSTNGTDWTAATADISAMIKGKDVGTYTLYWKLGSSGTTEAPVIATITKGTLGTEELKAIIMQESPTQIIFSTVHNLNSITASVFDVSKEQNRGVLAWKEEDVLYVASSETGAAIEAPADCSNLFGDCPTATLIDVSGLDTTNTTNMYRMFKTFGKNAIGEDVQILGLDKLKTSKVTNAAEMFMEAGMNANTVYAPKLDNLIFASNANTTDWRKDFGKNAVDVETGDYKDESETPDVETPEDQQKDEVVVQDDFIIMYANSLLQENITSSSWTATYNGTIINVDKINHITLKVVNHGIGEYVFTGILENTQGETLNVTVASTLTEQPGSEVTGSAQITLEDDIVTMHATSLEGEDVVTGSWTVTYEGTSLPVSSIDALTVSVPFQGYGDYIFSGTLVNSQGISTTITITSTITETT